MILYHENVIVYRYLSMFIYIDSKFTYYLFFTENMSL